MEGLVVSLNNIYLKVSSYKTSVCIYLVYDVWHGKLSFKIGNSDQYFRVVTYLDS